MPGVRGDGACVCVCVRVRLYVLLSRGAGSFACLSSCRWLRQIAVGIDVILRGLVNKKKNGRVTSQVGMQFQM